MPELMNSMTEGRFGGPGQVATWIAPDGTRHDMLGSGLSWSAGAAHAYGRCMCHGMRITVRHDASAPERWSWEPLDERVAASRYGLPLDRRNGRGFETIHYDVGRDELVAYASPLGRAIANLAVHHDLPVGSEIGMLASRKDWRERHAERRAWFDKWGSGDEGWRRARWRDACSFAEEVVDTHHGVTYLPLPGETEGARRGPMPARPALLNEVARARERYQYGLAAPEPGVTRLTQAQTWKASGWAKVDLDAAIAAAVGQIESVRAGEVDGQLPLLDVRTIAS